jgi:hypothetical protein
MLELGLLLERDKPDWELLDKALYILYNIL